MVEQKKGNQIFLSYGNPDKPFVRKLAKDLNKLGITVWFDEWEIMVGDSITGTINDAINKSAFFGAVISEDSVKRPWVQKELQTAMLFQIERKIKILPIVLVTSENIPPFIMDLRYADFRGSYQIGLRDLVLAIKPSQAGTVKILHKELSIEEKINWFDIDFSLNYLKKTSNQEPMMYSKNRKHNQILLDKILTEIQEEYAFHLRTVEYSAEAAHAGPKAAASYIRDDLMWHTILVFHRTYFDSPSATQIRELLPNGNSKFEALIFDSIKENTLSLVKYDRGFLFANEKQKQFILDKILSNFERFCLFKENLD